MVTTKAKVLSIVMVLMLALGLVGCAQPAATPAPAAPAAPAAKEFDQKPLTIIAPAGAGGGLDMASRTVAKIFNNDGIYTAAISVENKPGGGQVTGTVEFATKYSKDDYSLLLVSTPFILNHIKADGNSPIGPEEVYPLAELQSDFGILAVRADSPYNTLAELFDAIKADPTKVQFCGGGAPGTWDHTQSMMVSNAAGVDITTLKYNTYDGGGEALTALLGGHADVLTSDVSSIKQYLKAGEVKVLGISSAERLAEDEVMKDVPTYTEQGYAVVTANWRGLFMGKDASPEAKAFWEEAIGKLSQTEAWNTELANQGVQNTYKNAADFMASLQAEEAMYREVYAVLGLPTK